VRAAPVDEGRGAVDARARLGPMPAPPPTVDGPPTGVEVLRRLGPTATLSHEEAARHLGLELAADSGAARVTVPRNRSRLTVPGWRVVRADVPVQDVTLLPGGVRLTSALRTVADLARVLPLQHAVVAADSALRQRLVTVQALGQLLGAALGRGADRLRAVAGHADPLSGSVLESLLRVLLATSGLPAPVSQYPVRNEAGRVVARVDLCWPAQRLVVEADGFAFHSDRAAYRSDRVRMNELERLGWRVLRFTWEDVVNRPPYVVGLVQECLGAAQRAA
jgi:hypothetical protein